MIAIAVQIFKKHSHVNWALVDQILVSGANFITGILLARYLGIEEFGVFTLAWMVILFVSNLQLAAVISPMMSLGPKQVDEEFTFYFGSVLLQQLLFSGGLTILVLLGAKLSVYFFKSSSIHQFSIPLAFTVFAFQMQDFLRRYFYTKGHPSAAFFNDAVSYIGQIFVIIILAKMDYLYIEMVFWAIASTSAIAVAIGWFWVERMTIDLSHFKATVRMHFHYSKWLIVSAIMQWIGGNFFVIISAMLLSVSAVGAIAAARNIVGPTLILFGTLDNIIPVKASHIYKKVGWTGLIRYINRISLIGGVVTASICLGAALFAEPLISLFFGESYTPYSNLIYWFAITHFLMFFIRPLNGMLRTLEYTRPIAVSGVVSMFFSVMFSIPLIEKFNLIGAMIVMLGTQSLILCYLLWSVVGIKKRQRHEDMDVL